MQADEWTEGFLDINGGKMHYVRTGEDKQPLFLIHGFSDNGNCWLQTAIDLEDRYDIIMPDARGHGQSARVEPDEEFDLVEDLAEIIMTLGVENPIIWGHSMGAATAFQLGVRYPDIPKALILEDPPWSEVVQSAEDGEPKEHPLAPWVDAVSKMSLEEFQEETRQQHPEWPEWVISTWCPAKKQLDLNFLDLINMDRTGWLNTVPMLTCPTLVITADPDKGGIVTPEIAAQVQELNDLCEVVHIPGTGHHVRFEDYDNYMSKVMPFLEGLE